jgi:hypothetical protein
MALPFFVLGSGMAEQSSVQIITASRAQKVYGREGEPGHVEKGEIGLGYFRG